MVRRARHECRRHGGRDQPRRGTAERLGADVTDAAASKRLIAATIERHGRIDILVSNAGITRDQLMLRMKRDDWDEVLATNLTARSRCARRR